MNAPAAGCDFAFYGDDLTGSTDVLEAMSLGGIETALFLDPPTAEERAAAGNPAAVGVAGVSRAMSPAWMRMHLPPIFTALKALSPRIVQYKVCSTFDSAPSIGSIGTVMEIGLEVFGCGLVPIVVGVPNNGRFTAFGQLFATVLGGREAFRIDRHPVMSVHPKTPMREADLVRHLAAQTSLSVDLVDVRAMVAGEASTRMSGALALAPRGVLLDVLDHAMMVEAGRALAAHPWAVPTGFAVGSSGLNYGWAAVKGAPRAYPSPGAVERLVVVSGSCSPTTARQIAEAERVGFGVLLLDVDRLLRDDWLTEVDRGRQVGLALLDRQRGVVIATTRDAADPDIARIGAEAARRGIDTAERFGGALGLVARHLVETRNIRRLIVSGGDTSSFAGRALGVSALAMLAPVTPGSPLCRVTAGAAVMVGREILFKGGQVGGPDHFERTRQGVACTAPLLD